MGFKLEYRGLEDCNNNKVSIFEIYVHISYTSVLRSIHVLVILGDVRSCLLPQRVPF
jgi:hypothetical protein